VTNSFALTARVASGLRRGKHLMLMLLVLLFIDVCTTIVGLSFGFQELNPFVASMLRWTGLHGLWITKVGALGLAGYFLYSGRLALLRRVTVVMGVVVGWNLFWLITH
jgi:hypothetical protein